MCLLRRMEPYPNRCSFCQYYRQSSYFNNRKCDVFAHFDKQIPSEITKLHFDHRYPHPEDGGIQFKRKSIEALQNDRGFLRLSPQQIEANYQDVLEKLNTLHAGTTPDNQGHLPALWFMHDD